MLSTCLLAIGVAFFSLVTFIVILISYGKLTDFSGGADNGTFYPFLKNFCFTFQNAKLLGKLLMIPLIVYLAVVETLAIVVTMIILFFGYMFKFLFAKDETLAGAFRKVFNCNKWIVLEDDKPVKIGHTFMGYIWYVPYVQTDIDY